MDPVSLIVAAVVAGAATGVGEAAESAVKDLYGRLKKMLRQATRTHGEELSDDDLDKLAGDESALKAVIVSVGAADDGELVAQAREVLEASDPEGASIGKYRVTVSGGVVGSIGDGNTTHIGRIG